MNLIRHSDEVYLTRGPIATIGQDEVTFLKSAVTASPRGRIRINAHPAPTDGLHEMFIAIKADSYIRPHKHPGKSEAFHMVYGDVDIVVFDDSGEIDQIVQLSTDPARGAFYYRMSEPHFHTLYIRSDLLIVHEITNGPFRAAETALAQFAPDENDLTAVTAYRDALAHRVTDALQSR